mmetsp:Transcript_4272/g.13316  ORF Transcript_4272/g.13316 Transcript_4272/m.13316 type:complete len:131 (+) Transcript_4272:333-725(+)
MRVWKVNVVDDEYKVIDSLLEDRHALGTALLRDRSLVMQLVKRDACFFEFADVTLRGDRRVAKIALDKGGSDVLRHVGDDVTDVSFSGPSSATTRHFNGPTRASKEIATWSYVGRCNMPTPPCDAIPSSF